MFDPELRQRVKFKTDTTEKSKHAGEPSEESCAARSTKRSWLLNRPLLLILDDAIPIAVLAVAGCCVHYGKTLQALFLGFICAWLVWRVLPPKRQKRNVRVVCISDTHGKHRDLCDLPAGDILIHAGDFTKFGSLEDAKDFNDWLGSLEFEHKIAVNGNHENNAPWQSEMESILTNASFLKQRSITVKGLEIYGVDFCWPMKTESPYFALIPESTDIVVAHGPAKGLVDGGMGCRALLWAMARVRPRLVVSGHIHEAHGQCEGLGTLRGTKFVNAANCRGGYSIGWGPVVVDL